MSRRGLAAACAAGAVAVVAVVAIKAGDKPRDPSVVRVELAGATSAAELATGFVVAPGRVVTVAHVLEPDRRLVVRQGAVTRNARVLREDRRNDLALLAVPGLAAPAFAGESARGNRLLVRRGVRTTTVPASVRRPIRATVRGPDWGPYRRPALELAADVELGDSGAPLVDSDGHVAGVLFARAGNGRNTAYAVRASAIEPLLAR